MVVEAAIDDRAFCSLIKVKHSSGGHTEMVAKSGLWLRDPSFVSGSRVHATSSRDGNRPELQKPLTRWPFSKVALIYALIFHVIMGEKDPQSVHTRCRSWNVEADGETGTRRERMGIFKDASPVGIARRMGWRAIYLGHRRAPCG